MGNSLCDGNTLHGGQGPDDGAAGVAGESRLGEGSKLLFLETKSVAMVVKPVKENPELDLVEHLLRFKGVVIPARVHKFTPRT